MRNDSGPPPDRDPPPPPQQTFPPMGPSTIISPRYRTGVTGDGTEYLYPEFQSNAQQLIRGFPANLTNSRPTANLPTGPKGIFNGFPPAQTKPYEARPYISNTGNGVRTGTISVLGQLLRHLNSSPLASIVINDTDDRFAEEVPARMTTDAFEPFEETPLPEDHERAASHLTMEELWAIQRYLTLRCNQCKRYHIRRGPLETIFSRDPCGSYMPDWVLPEQRGKAIGCYIDLVEEIMDLSIRPIRENLHSGVTARQTSNNSSSRGAFTFGRMDIRTSRGLLISKRRYQLKNWAEDFVWMYGLGFEIATELVANIPDEIILSEDLFPEKISVKPAFYVSSDDDDKAESSGVQNITKRVGQTTLADQPAKRARHSSRSPSPNVYRSNTGISNLRPTDINPPLAFRPRPRRSSHNAK